MYSSQAWNDARLSRRIDHLEKHIADLDDPRDDPHDDPRDDGTLWSGEVTLDSPYFVLPGNALSIAPGTAIKCSNQGSFDKCGMLVVCKGASLYAEGTKDEPIVFTAADEGADSTATGLWGGVLVLGEEGDAHIFEGFAGTSYKQFMAYGGGDARTIVRMQYVEIKHGGFEIATDQEINGLTLCGVSDQDNLLANIHVMYNKDDGIEWFGGSINASNLVVAHCGDDSFDVDQGYEGTIRNAVAVGDGGDKALEAGSALPPTSVRIQLRSDARKLVNQKDNSKITFLPGPMDDLANAWGSVTLNELLAATKRF